MTKKETYPYNDDTDLGANAEIRDCVPNKEKLKNELLEKAKDNLSVNIRLYSIDHTNNKPYIMIENDIIEIKNYEAYIRLIGSEIHYRNELIESCLNEIGKL